MEVIESIIRYVINVWLENADLDNVRWMSVLVFSGNGVVYDG